MSSHPRINYELAVASYMEKLTTMLRGFGPTDEMAFLATWVPDEDHHTSILGLFQAAEESSVPALEVLVGKDSLPEAKLLWLQESLSKLGKVSVESQGDQILLTVVFGSSEPVQLTSGTKELLNPVYHREVEKLCARKSYQGVVSAVSDCLLVEVTCQSTIRLMCLVDKNHIVQKARYSGTQTLTETALLEGLCPLLENKPILECSDHAVMELEHSLRDHSMPPPVPGLLMLENCDSAFMMPLHLVRQLLSDYRSATAYRSFENFHVKPSSARWQGLSDERRREEITAALKNFPGDLEPSLDNLEGDRRVFVRIAKPSCSAGSFGHSLMQLEAHLQKQVESTIEVHLPAKADLNTIREINRVEA